MFVFIMCMHLCIICICVYVHYVYMYAHVHLVMYYVYVHVYACVHLSVIAECGELIPASQKCGNGVVELRDSRTVLLPVTAGFHLANRRIM